MKMLVVDARARRLASQLLADFLDAKITNDEYNDAFPASTIDPGLLNSNRRSFGCAALAQDDSALRQSSGPIYGQSSQNPPIGVLPARGNSLIALNYHRAK